MVCPYCGKWNDDQDHRCGHCGRRAVAEPVGSWKRTGLDDDAAFLKSLSPSERYLGPPPPVPAWKEELQRKLSDYRARKNPILVESKPEDAASGLSGDPEFGSFSGRDPLAGGGRPAPPAKENVVSFDELVADRGGWTIEELEKLSEFTGSAPPRSPDPPAARKRTPDPGWRRVERAMKTKNTANAPAPIVPAGSQEQASAAAPIVPSPKPRPGPVQLRLPPIQGKRQDAPEEEDAFEVRDAELDTVPSSQVRLRDINCRIPIAPIRIRSQAAAVDLLLLVVSLGLFAGVAYLSAGDPLLEAVGVRSFAAAVMILASFYWMFYLRFAAETPGMMWLGLRVLNFDGEVPTNGQRATRAAGCILSSATLGLGFFWALIDEEGLTWHDRMSKTFLARECSSGARDGSQEAPRQSPEAVPRTKLPALPARQTSAGSGD